MSKAIQEERDRITMLRELLQMSQTEFARQIGISQGALSQIENGRSRVSMETLKNLSTEFNVNCNWLVNGKGDIFYVSHSDKKSSSKNTFIPLIDKKARAGYFKGFSNPEYLKTLDLYQIPGYENGDYRMFEIHGDSMVPSLFPTEIVIAKKIENFKKVEDGTISVILLTKELLAKRLFHSEDGKEHYMAKCDNPDYEGRKIKFTEIKEIWTVSGKITHKFLKDSIYDLTRLQKMEKNIQALQEKLNQIAS